MKDHHEALLGDLLATAWAIIANANGGDWDRATPEWKDAALRWRDRYFAINRVGSDAAEIPVGR